MITTTNIRLIKLVYNEFRLLRGVWAYGANNVFIDYLRFDEGFDLGFNPTTANALNLLTGYQSTEGITIEYLADSGKSYAETPTAYRLAINANPNSSLKSPPQWMIAGNWFYQQTNAGASGSSGPEGQTQWATLTLFSANVLRPGLPLTTTFDGDVITPPTDWLLQASPYSNWMAISSAVKTSSATSWTIGGWSLIQVVNDFVQFNAGNNTPYHNVYTSADTHVRYRLPNGAWTLDIPLTPIVNFDWEVLADIRVSGSHFSSDPLTERTLSMYEEFLITAEFWNDTEVIGQQSIILPRDKFTLLASANRTTNQNLYLGANAMFVVFDSQTYTRQGITYRTSWPVTRNEPIRDVLAAARFNFASGIVGTTEGYSTDGILRAVRRFGIMHPNNTIRIQLHAR